MHKRIKNGLFGFFVGISLNVLLGIFIFSFSQTPFSLVTPKFEESVGSELYAVILQIVISGLLGTGIATISTEIKDEWSPLKRLGIHFCCVFIVLFPVGLFLGWIDLHRGFYGMSIVQFVMIYILTYIVVWVIQMLYLKWLVFNMNKKVKKGGK